MSDLPVNEQPIILFTEECDRRMLREENQDSALHIRIALGDLLIVADGISESAGGATASRLAVEYFYAHMAALPDDYPADNALREAAARANTSIAVAARAPGSPHPRMGSTVVVALLQQHGNMTEAWIGHIGNSRAYLIRAGRLHRLTTDHTAVQTLLNRNLITPEEAKDHPDATVLTRCLGHQLDVEIEIEQLPLAVGDTLLLCSHGLWGYVPESEIQTAAATLSIEATAHKLLELALTTGGHNNIGIEVAQLSAPPDPASRHQTEHNPATKWVITVFLLAIAGLCVLAWLTFWSN
ncbi:MAG: PP2C family protein-serine/threonine phosphatase [Terracidiphilus sp.]